MKRLVRLALRVASAALLSGTSALAIAGPGHDHADDAVPKAGPNSPQRQSDGSVFLPKRSQRQLGVRTIVVARTEVAGTVELAGRVIADPGAGGRVQAMQPGRLEALPRGMPSLGQRVVRGEVLAYVVPAIAALERGAQQAQLAELRAQLAIAEKRVARYAELEGTVPRRDLDQARIEAEGLRGRIASLEAALGTREPLIASASGLIATIGATAGQMLDARELVFEIVDPSRLRIEAVTYDSAVANAITGGRLMKPNGEVIALGVVGAATVLRDLAIPVQFRLSAQSKGGLQLSVGELVRVVAQLKRKNHGLPVPASALVRNAANEYIVWAHTEPERFVPKTVTFEPLDGANVLVTSGLQPEERVVVRAANLVNQVR